MTHYSLETATSVAPTTTDHSRLQDEANDTRFSGSHSGFTGAVESVVNAIPAPVATIAAAATGMLSRMPGALGIAGKVLSTGVGLTYGTDLVLRLGDHSQTGYFTSETGKDALVLGSLGLGALSGSDLSAGMAKRAGTAIDTRPFNVVAEDWKTIPQWAQGTHYPEVRAQFLNGINHFSTSDQSDIRRALSVAEDAHMGQVRMVHSGSALQDPYIIHPVRTSMFLTQEAGVKDADTIVSSLLHDTVEDSNGRYSVADLSKAFNPNVGSIVKGVTKPPTIDGIKPDLAPYYESLHNAPVSIRNVKLADRIDNMRDTEELTEPAFQARKLQETIDHYVPMAEKTSPFMTNALNQAIEKLQASIKSQ